MSQYKAILKAYNAVTHTATVFLMSSFNTYLYSVPVALNIPPSEMIADRYVCLTAFSSAFTDCVITAVWNAASIPLSFQKMKQTEIDFGTAPVAEKEFTVTDADVTATSRIVGCVAYVAPTGKELDELECDAIDLKFSPAAGSFKIYAKGLEGYVSDKFKVYYIVDKGV